MLVYQFQHILTLSKNIKAPTVFFFCSLQSLTSSNPSKIYKAGTDTIKMPHLSTIYLTSMITQVEGLIQVNSLLLIYMYNTALDSLYVIRMKAAV